MSHRKIRINENFPDIHVIVERNNIFVVPKNMQGLEDLLPMIAQEFR